ncbi:MAG: DUF1616 domain-containing protein [Archaeoglobaceae archaeon]
MKVLTYILLFALLACIALTIYVALNPKEESFTEFYILGEKGRASDYPTHLFVNESAKVIVGIVNREHENLTYVFRVKVDNRTIYEEKINLAHGEKIEFPFVFSLSEEGRKKVEFLLYRNESVYRSLHLWVNVYSYGS